ncbi:hypothetical protein [Glaciecola sp. KUL10]|uniref:hypothetical protein n=1 Tax=Glaciecola sp. (strain KUL10) TaxID=2161813 RepID=UPI000D788EA6|nr:hypothetical protein [Glaciecola sp. KUL10]GBL04363.1 hypothetical protein KUL10_16690 [Glaciecola sp. KUL10]
MISPINGAQSALYSGFEGYKRGEAKVTEAAANIATRPAQSNLNESVVDLTTGSLQAQASASVIKRADEMLGTLIDTLA